MRGDRDRLQDILEAIDRIEQYTAGGRATFDQNELVQTWVIYHSQILGEAVRGLSAQLIAQHPQVPWSAIIGMRNILIHTYFKINRDAVWRVVEHDIPVLKQHIVSILATLKP